MRMIRVRVEDSDFDYLTTLAADSDSSLAGLVRDVLHAFVVSGLRPVSEPSDTPVEAPVLAPGKVGRPTRDQWERLNKWLAATGRQPDEGTITTKSGLLAWAVSQGFQP